MNESESTHQKYKNDPYKPIIKVLKALRKAEKYKLKAQKYAPRPQPRPEGWDHDDSSSESSEEWSPYGGPYHSSYPGSPPNRPNRPGIFESSASASSGGSSSGGGNNGNRLPVNPRGEEDNGGQDPLQQVNRGISSFLEQLGSLTLGQLAQGTFSFPSN